VLGLQRDTSGSPSGTGFALASQAWVAWTLRKQPHIGVAWALALYQLGSATADWVMWIVLADQKVFSTTLGQILVMVSIPTHYTLGFLLVRAIRQDRATQRQRPSRESARRSQSAPLGTRTLTR
jgi:predicted membrane protein